MACGCLPMPWQGCLNEGVSQGASLFLAILAEVDCAGGGGSSQLAHPVVVPMEEW